MIYGMDFWVGFGVGFIAAPIIGFVALWIYVYYDSHETPEASRRHN